MQPNIPDLSNLENQSSQLAVQQIVGHSPPDYKIYAFVMNYVRIVELAIHDYESGRYCIDRYYNRGNGQTVAIGLHIAAAGHFEMCVSNMKRAIDLLKRIRGYRGISNSARNFLRTPGHIVSDKIEGPISQMRHAIQHLESAITRGEIENIEPIYLFASENSIQLADQKIQYMELARWLADLHTLTVKLVTDWKASFSQGL